MDESTRKLVRDWPTREEFDEALKYAEDIYDFVLSLLPAAARP